MTPLAEAKVIARGISRAGLTIYDPIVVGDPWLWLTTPALQALLHDGLVGTSMLGMANRTRSKYVNQEICRVLGYPVPSSFPRVQPRFPGQDFDKYVQKSNNLQIWNEKLSATRRYVLIRVDERDRISRVKVVTGASLAPLDTTVRLTRKYQARCLVGPQVLELVTPLDTERLAPVVAAEPVIGAVAPIAEPRASGLIPIAALFDRLKTLIGATFLDPGHDQERLRGGALHRLVCRALGYASFQDDGQFPDVRHQILEVKLQTSATIDLGLVLPSADAPLDVPLLNGTQVRHCDVRYAVFHGRIEHGQVVLSHLIMTTGEGFFARFPQFGGNVLNTKLQIPLPRHFFET